MDAAETTFSGPLGSVLAILAMTLATYGCRIAGVLVMRRVRPTPLIERALAALPGSIVAATVLPLALRSGPAALAGVAAGLLTMLVVRREIVGLLAGLATTALARALGL